jgi:hypothetical protein
MKKYHSYTSITVISSFKGNVVPKPTEEDFKIGMSRVGVALTNPEVFTLLDKTVYSGEINKAVYIFGSELSIEEVRSKYPIFFIDKVGDKHE